MIQSQKQVRTLDELPAGPVRNALADFLRRYGHRAVREAEIAEPRWSEDISTLIVSIAILTKQEEPLNAEALSDAAKERHANAEAQLLGALPLYLAPVARRVLNEVASGIRRRELFRGRVVEVLGIYRKIALEISKRMTDLEPRLGEDCAFYLSVDELMAWLDEPGEQIDVQIDARRKQHERYNAMAEPPITFVNRPSESSIHVSRDQNLLKGLAVCPGSVQGRARIVYSAEDARVMEPEEILVTRVVDVGWAPIFAGCRAVVSELGGPLSHAGVVLRELGIPAVFNLAEATQVLRTGDLIRVDGSAGTVERLRESALN